ncbi:MAG TPA: methyltransferase domain-containing protein [Candidatus Polarisedimenticolaceae bacterium]|nr:methyltransferase domain-containing protein [Candidatus Polarisedimenticolaceae bacterium]
MQAQQAYVLGHSERELRRLTQQARRIDPITRRFLREAGIAHGMRVLDVGTGVGNVAFLAAELVGAAGEVVGVDRAEAALAVARARAAERGLAQVSFFQGDAAELRFERPFDAVIGRYVLMFQPDPVAVLRRLAGHLGAGGLVVFHEIDWEGARSYPPVPSYDRCSRWIVETLGAYGHETRMGVKLHAAYRAAGLPAPAMQSMEVIGGGADAIEEIELITDAIGTTLPEMERLGIATAAEVDPATLTERIRGEIAARESVIVGRSEIGAWARLPR